MNLQELLKQRQKILDELSSLERMRKGSIVEQFLEVKNKRGKIVRRGPYPLYSYKEQGRTVSRRLRSSQEVETYRKDIATFRRFEELTAELRRLGEALCEVGEGRPEKKQPRSLSSKTPK
jgi:hypothetical protein